jgi:YihY family inner membrane protein
MSAISILKQSISSFREDECLNLSAAIAFYAILSLIPFLYLLISLIGFLIGTEGEILPKVSSYVTQLIPFISKPVLREVGRINLGSGIFAWFAVFFMLWSSTLIFDSIEFSLKKVFNVRHLRPFWISKIMSLLFVPVAGLLFILLQVFGLFIDAFVRLNSYFGITVIPLFLNNIALKYIFPFLLTFVLLSALYAIVPPARISLRQAMVGGFICATMLEVAKHVFGWMIKHNPNYGVVYGSLNTLIIMVIWIFYASAIFLFCAEIIAVYQRQ